MTVTKEKFYIIKPKAGINLCTNPSMEGTTTGWTPGGTNTVACDATVQTRGVYSMKCTYSNDDIYAYSPITITDAVHVASIDVYVPTSYTGTKLVFYFMSFTSSTPVDGEVDMTIRDRWQTVTCSITPDSGDLSGYISINEDGVAAGVGEYFYIDGCQVEIGSTPTTYFDGNISETIKGVRQYYWTGADNGSTSVRLATTRSGGELIDITDYCKKIDVIGLGMAPTDVNSIGLVDGTKRYQRTNLTSRYFTLAVAFNGTSIGTVQTNRNALIDLVKPDLVPYQQPMIIRYQGETDAGLAASEPIDIKCTYVSGLDTGLQRDFERANIVFEIHDSYLQKAYDSGAVLDYVDTLADADYIVKRDSTGVWSAMDGVTGTVYAIAQHPITKEIYIGGEGLNMGGDGDADYLAKWDASAGAWVAVVAGCNGIVRALAFDPSGNLYIGGAFTNWGDADGDYIVEWDGSSLVSLDTGLAGQVYSLAFATNGDLYIGGQVIYGLSGICYWDGSSFNALGAGIAGIIYALAFSPDGDLYIGGDFDNVTDANGDNITKWSGAAFSSLDEGLNNTVRALAFGTDGNLYIGGLFFEDYDGTISYFTRWNGQKFDITESETGDVHALKFSRDGLLYIKDDYYARNGIYQSLDINLPGSPTIYNLFFDNLDNFYIGFSTSGDAETAGDTDVSIASAVSYPIITVTGPGLLRQIVNTTTGKGLYFNDLTLLAGEVITMDLRPGRIKMTSNFRGSVLGYVLTGSTYDFPLMPGTNRIATFIDGTPDANTLVTMQWVENYHGIDGAQYA